MIDIDRNSPDFGKIQYLDIGNGNYPFVLKRRDNYWSNDTRSDTMSILFEETDEDVNHNGVLDPGEDTDADGVLDRPNYLPGHNPTRDDLASRVIVDRRREDEMRHGASGEALGAAAMPRFVRSAMRAAARVMTRTAFRI